MEGVSVDSDFCSMCSEAEMVVRLEMEEGRRTCPVCGSIYIGDISFEDADYGINDFIPSHVNIPLERALRTMISNAIRAQDEANREGRELHEREISSRSETESLISPATQMMMVPPESQAGQVQNINPPEGTLEQFLEELNLNDDDGITTPEQITAEDLPTVMVSEKVQCPVCLDDLSDVEEVKEMGCKHQFHVNCILPWLRSHGSCPVCRFEMTIERAESSSSGDAGEGDESRSVYLLFHRF